MARTKQELTDISARRIREQNQKALNWGGFISSMNRLNQSERGVLLAAIMGGDTVVVGTTVVNAVNLKHTADADAEAASILADDNADLAELDRIL